MMGPSDQPAENLIPDDRSSISRGQALQEPRRWRQVQRPANATKFFMIANRQQAWEYLAREVAFGAVGHIRGELAVTPAAKPLVRGHAGSAHASHLAG
jgi:hypothetical protein